MDKQDTACIKGLDSCLVSLLSKVCECYPSKPRLNHGNDGSHSSNSRHYSNKAIDMSGNDFKDGDRWTTDESLAIAKCICGKDLVYDEDNDYYKASFTIGDCNYTILYESPDTDNSHIHIQVDSGDATGTKSNPLPCECPTNQPAPAAFAKLSHHSALRKMGTDTAEPATPAPPYFVRVTLSNGFVQRLKTSASGDFQVILPPDTRGVVSLYSPQSRQYWHSEFLSARMGGTTLLTFQSDAEWARQFSFPGANYENPQQGSGRFPWSPDDSDQDGDGLGAFGEAIVGTSPTNPDTDGDGVLDGAEIQQGTDPLSGLQVATGVVGSADTPGTAYDVCAVNDLAIIADRSAGVAVFNVFNGLSPVLVAQVDTPGDATAVACGGTLITVADGPASLAVIDISNPASAGIVHQVNLGSDARAVTVAGSIAFVGLQNGQVVSVDMISGTVLNRLTLGTSSIQDVLIAGDVLYALRAGTLHAISFLDGELTGSSSVLSPGGVGAGQRRLRLSAGGGLLYATFNSGYNIFDLANPEQPALLRQNNTTQAGWKQIIANGSGLGFAAVSPNSTDDGPHDVSIYDLRPGGTNSQFLTTFVTPGLAAAVSIYNGIGYVADSAAGLQVVNYLAYDALGVAPTIALSTSFAAGSAEEGKIMRLTAAVTDDVQVRNVEFYVDGVKVLTDGNFPFEHRFVTPLRTATRTSFTVRARATDTGGNSTWSEELVFNLIPDATPPRVRSVRPINFSIAGSVDTVAAFLSEPIELSTMNSISVRLIAAGPDNVFGNADDLLVTGGIRSYRDSINGVFLEFGTTLPPGSYQATVGPPLADLAGNVITAAYRWTFRIFDRTDNDQDGVPDELEALLGLNPNNSDSDGDGISDGAEDFDNDGLSNAGEIILGTNPQVLDTDGDGIKDGDEDSDGDGLKDGDEIRYGTNPLLADSDGDGWPDESEVTGGSNPLDPGSRPRLLFIGKPFVSTVLPAAVPLADLSPGVTVAQPPVSAVLTGVGSGDGLPFNVVLARPPVFAVLPAAVPTGGLAPGVTVAPPPVSIVLPVSTDTGGLPLNVFIGQPPVAVVLPTPASADGLAPGVTFGQPRVDLVLPAADQSGGLAPNVTLGQPPVFVAFADQ